MKENKKYGNLIGLCIIVNTLILLISCAGTGTKDKYTVTFGYTAAGQYYYQNEVGIYRQSNLINFVSAFSLSHDSVTTGRAADFPAGYEIYRALSKTGPWVRIANFIYPANTLSQSIYYLDTNYAFEPMTAYWYKLIIESNESPIVCGCIYGGIPTNISISSNLSGGIQIVWSPVENASGYVLYRWNTTNDADHIRLHALTTNFYDTNCMSNTYYSYRVAASNNDIGSVASYNDGILATGRRY